MMEKTAMKKSSASSSTFVLADKIAKFIPFIALIGEACAPPEWTSPLTKEEAALVENMLKKGKRDTAFVEALLDRIEPVFPDESDNQKHMDRFQETQERIEQAYEDGLIVSYQEKNQPEISDIANSTIDELNIS